jgi:hypothetical protein
VYLLSTVLNTVKYHTCLAHKNLHLCGEENKHGKLANFIMVMMMMIKYIEL